MFFQNTDYSFAEDVLAILEEHPELKEKYNVLLQLAKPELKDGQQILTLNDNKLLKDGQLASSYYENFKNLADPNVEKVKDTEKNLYISNMFKALPLMALYQNGVGYSKYGFNEALPFDDFISIMEPVSEDFIASTKKTDILDEVFDRLSDPKNKFFRNYVNITPGQISVKPITKPSTQPTATGKQVTYAPVGEQRQTYTIRGAQIFNSSDVEVFKTDSVDRNKIFANLAVKEGRAVVVEHNGNKYAVNKKDQIISGVTGKIMNWPENNGDRKAILNKAAEEFGTSIDPIAARKTEILNSPEFKSWLANELSKNPNLDAEKALDYYIKCKGL